MVRSGAVLIGAEKGMMIALGAAAVAHASRSPMVLAFLADSARGPTCGCLRHGYLAFARTAALWKTIVITWLARIGIQLIVLSLAFDTFGGSANGTPF